MATKVFSRRALRAASVLALTAGCALPALAQVNLQFSSSTINQPWYLNDVQTISFTVTNAGTTTSVGGPNEPVHFSIPLETEVVSALPTECAGGTKIFSCELPSLAPGASHTYTFDIEATALYEPPGNGLDLRFNAIPVYDPTGGTSPTQQLGSSSLGEFFASPMPFYIIPRPATPAPANTTAVPTLDVFGLGLLAAAMGVMGMRRRKKAAA